MHSCSCGDTGKCFCRHINLLYHLVPVKMLLALCAFADDHKALGCLAFKPCFLFLNVAFLQSSHMLYEGNMYEGNMYEGNMYSQPLCSLDFHWASLASRLLVWIQNCHRCANTAGLPLYNHVSILLSAQSLNVHHHRADSS